MENPLKIPLCLLSTEEMSEINCKLLQRACPARNISAWTSKANLPRLAWETRHFAVWLQGKILSAASI